MGVDSYPKSSIQFERDRSEKVVYVMDPGDDEIDLGDLFRKLIGEWKTIALVMVAGLLLSLVGSFVLTKAHQVEAVIRAPTVNELADLNNQSLLQITPDIALEKFVDQLLSYDLQLEVFVQVSLFELLSKDSSLTSSQLFSGIQKSLSVNLVKHDYYELAKKEKTPFKQIQVSLASSKPELVAEYIYSLINKAQESAVIGLSNDIATIRDYKIESIQDQLHSMSMAANTARLAKIRRLEELNREKIAGLKMQIDLLISNAKIKRENSITHIREALNTAKKLDIVDPVTWDDLRTSRVTSQITNEFGGTDKTAPYFFRGTRILSAELERLGSRQDDRPFIGALPDIEKQILELENDPSIAALKARQDDTIYIEKYDELQQALSELVEMPVDYSNVQLAIISQPPLVSTSPTRNPRLIILAGLFLSGVLALFITLIRISLRKKEPIETGLT